MEYANFKIGKSFDEAVKDNLNLYEIFLIGTNGYRPKRYLCQISIREETKYYLILITLYDKFGRRIKGWNNTLTIIISKDYNIIDYLKLDIIEKSRYGILSLSKDKAYHYCVNILRGEIQNLRKKEIQIREMIYDI